MNTIRFHIFNRQMALIAGVSIFAIFVGSQITEGALLVPYWQSLSPTAFYDYYNEFGPSIGQFYTVLTIIAALIPIIIAVYSKIIMSKAFKFAVISSILAMLCIVAFYVYFKGTNQLFYDAALAQQELSREIVIWKYWHWGRVFIECSSLFFLIIAVTNIDQGEQERERDKEL